MANTKKTSSSSKQNPQPPGATKHPTTILSGKNRKRSPKLVTKNALVVASFVVESSPRDVEHTPPDHAVPVVTHVEYTAFQHADGDIPETVYLQRHEWEDGNYTKIGVVLISKMPSTWRTELKNYYGYGAI